ncbi:CrcB family protein [Spirillospora sp. NPDC049652]|jgi:CrcB protein
MTTPSDRTQARREAAEASALHPPAHPGPPPAKPGLSAQVIIDVALGGALGAVVRYLLSEVIPAARSGFPWNTFTVNMLGCLAMGLLTTYLLRGRPHPMARPFAVTGYLGGFTTFSHLIDGIHTLGRDGRPGLGFAYAATSVVVGWIAVAVGLVLGARIPHHTQRRQG